MHPWCLCTGPEELFQCNLCIAVHSSRIPNCQAGKQQSCPAISEWLQNGHSQGTEQCSFSAGRKCATKHNPQEVRGALNARCQVSQSGRLQAVRFLQCDTLQRQDIGDREKIESCWGSGDRVGLYGLHTRSSRARELVYDIVMADIRH